MARTRLETRARARALQALYAWEMRGGEANLERVATQVWDDMAITPEERRVAGPLVRFVAQRQRELDEELADVTTNWRLERVGAIERCVLRLAAAEMTIGETPPRVVIQEAVTLAERFGSGASAKFVNGVLDALARRMGRM
jgi:transcription antitermination protein NusB